MNKFSVALILTTLFAYSRHRGLVALDDVFNGVGPGGKKQTRTTGTINVVGACERISLADGNASHELDIQRFVGGCTRLLRYQGRQVEVVLDATVIMAMPDSSLRPNATGCESRFSLELLDIGPAIVADL
jgi:hypothetical protein